MTNTVSVGRFATMTHLSVKTLRHYHQVGLLEPAEVDAETGYRYYTLDQLPTAQLIRRLRDLRMPVADVREVLVAGSPIARDSLISAHIDHLETELAKTQAAVNSLRALLDLLPIAGGSGTLADRFLSTSTNQGPAGWLRAKTGSLTAINALVGVVTDHSGRVLTFAFLSNAAGPNGRNAMDALATKLWTCGCT